MIKRFNDYINESLLDKMKPKSNEELKKELEKLSPYQALSFSYKYEKPELIKFYSEKIKPINDKLYQDSQKYNKDNLTEFMDLIIKWVDDQGGNSDHINDIFDSLLYRIRVNTNDYYDEWENDSDVEWVDDEPSTKKQIFSDNTINLFKQLLISYVIDYVSHNSYIPNNRNLWNEDYYEEGWDVDYDEELEDE